MGRSRDKLGVLRRKTIDRATSSPSLGHFLNTQSDNGPGAFTHNEGKRVGQKMVQFYGYSAYSVHKFRARAKKSVKMLDAICMCISSRRFPRNISLAGKKLHLLSSSNMSQGQARRSGYDKSRKTHIQSSFKSFGNWLYTSTIQCGCGMLRQTLPENAMPTLDEASCPNC